jgi:hypothetical protein
MRLTIRRVKKYYRCKSSQYTANRKTCDRYEQMESKLKTVKLLLVMLSVIAVAACGGGGGGNSSAPPTTYSISGTAYPGTTLNLSGKVTASTTADASGLYSFSGLTDGIYTVTPSFSGCKFWPASNIFPDGLLGRDWSSRDFLALSPTGGPCNGTSTRGAGVTFSGNLIGSTNFMSDSSWDHAGATLQNGVLPQILYTWNDGFNNSQVAMHIEEWGSVDQPATVLYFTFDTYVPSAVEPGINYVGCKVDPSNTTTSWPSCSSLGITFNSADGMVTFTTTSILLFSSNAPTGITATGSLSFPPF